MALRDVIQIDEGLCDGCGDCVTACAEGAIQIVGGTARLVSEVYCDGLGACLGHCPRGAITVVRREAEAFDVEAVERHLARREADRGVSAAPACAGSATRSLPTFPPVGPAMSATDTATRLRNWPVQLHLVSPAAPHLHGAELLLAADCTAFAMAAFHARLLDGRALAVACPKLDSNQRIYLDKLVAMIDHAGIAGLTVAVMEVPCCGGLVRLARAAAGSASRPVPVREIVIGVSGAVLRDTGGDRPRDLPVTAAR